MPCSITQPIRTKYINYGVQGKRESKHVVEKKKKTIEDEFGPMPEEVVNLENDRLVPHIMYLYDKKMQ